MPRMFTPRAMATGLTSLSPKQKLAIGIAALGALSVAGPAWAGAGIPGVGTVIKCYCSPPPKGKSIWAVTAPTDGDGVVSLTGLAPAEYEIKLIGAEQGIKVSVGADGALAFTAREDKGRQWVQPLRLTAAAPVRPIAINVPRTFSIIPPTPCAPPMRGMVRNPACHGGMMNYIDVNTSTAEGIVRLAPATSPEAARLIVDERTSGSTFKDVGDFARHVCPKVAINFGLAPTRIGDTSIIARADYPRAEGLKCAPGAPVVELYGRKHNYVGHVTLLK